MMTKIRGILLVDHDSGINLIHRTIIEDSGYGELIKVSEYPEEALEVLGSVASGEVGSDEWFPSIVFLDINMPGMNGFQFIEKFEQFPPSFRDEISIVMLTTSLNPADLEESTVHKGVKAFVPKPLDMESFAETLEDIF